MDYGHCNACEHEAPAEDFPTREVEGGDWEHCPRCGSMDVELIANAGRPDPKLEDARRCLREANSIGVASHNLSVELGTGEGTARKHLARAIRADIANEYNLDADEVDRLVRLAVTKQ